MLRLGKRSFKSDSGELRRNRWGIGVQVSSVKSNAVVVKPYACLQSNVTVINHNLKCCVGTSKFWMFPLFQNHGIFSQCGLCQYILLKTVTDTLVLSVLFQAH